MRIGPFFIERNRIVLLVLLVLFIYFVLQINALQTKLTPLQEQAATARAQGTKLAKTQISLQTQVAYATSDDAVEDYARGEGHMIQPGDNPVIVIPVEGPTVVPTAIPETTQKQLSPLETWIYLIFGYE